MDLRVSAYTLTSAVGTGLTALRDALRDRRSGLRPNDFPHSQLDTWIGRVGAVEEYDWDGELKAWESRNNALAALALEQDGFLQSVQQLADRIGRERVAVVIGTSTSSIGRTEAAYRELEGDRMAARFRQPRVHNPHSPGDFVAWRCGLQGPTLTISTACSSSAKVFATAARWLELGLADAALVGGVDSLCLSVLHGFHSLQLTSPEPCRPFDAARRGINIGEAGGFALLVPADPSNRNRPRLSGYGESSDAHHMSHPHPEGAGALACMRSALKRAGLKPEEIAYINLHGTASQANDTVEASALEALFPPTVTAASTKGWTGHTLGAAGITEAVIALEALETGLAAGTLNLEQPDPELAFPIAQDNAEGRCRHVMSNSFGFGGNNCSLVFSEGGS